MRILRIPNTAPRVSKAKIPFANKWREKDQKNFMQYLRDKFVFWRYFMNTINVLASGGSEGGGEEDISWTGLRTPGLVGSGRRSPGSGPTTNPNRLLLES
jgi:hypothetical protein